MGLEGTVLCCTYFLILESYCNIFRFLLQNVFWAPMHIKAFFFWLLWPETRLKCQSIINLWFWFFIIAFGKKHSWPQEGYPRGWQLQLLGMVLRMWTVRLNLLLFLEFFLIENVNVLSFILAAECSAS